MNQIYNLIEYADAIEKDISNESILSYLEKADGLMFQEEDVVQKVIGKLKNSIKKWADINCDSYKNKNGIIEKEELQDKSKWYVSSVSFLSQDARTSGSTTGVPFEYLRLAPVFEKIEWDYHYNLVLDEFNIGQSPHVLYMMPHHYKRSNKYVFSEGCSSELNLVNHGNKRSPIIHYADFEAYKNDRDNFFFQLFEYIKNNPIDVFYTSAPEVNSLCSYIRKFEIKNKLGFLLSNTNEKLFSSDAAFLLDNNFFDHICDHMRCWDGGASFFTCKHKTYHLMDELSWVESIDGKLVCTDYFNLASPFIKYWNGDYCRVEDGYKRCECGRLYREFEFLENRPFSLKGTCIKEIKDKMKDLQIKGIKQVRCAPEFLEVVSNKELSEEEKSKINALTEKFKFKFSVEV